MNFQQRQRGKAATAPAQATSNWKPSFSPWRHGGWYIDNARYPDGAIGCVSSNYPDGKWRVVCDPRGFENGPAFETRREAAMAEYELVQQEYARLPSWFAEIEDCQLAYRVASLIKDLRRQPSNALDELVDAKAFAGGVDRVALKQYGLRFLAEEPNRQLFN